MSSQQQRFELRTYGVAISGKADAHRAEKRQAPPGRPRRRSRDSIETTDDLFETSGRAAVAISS